jgi:menaquinone-dependent protoporphyrinogen IX oxidase
MNRRHFFKAAFAGIGTAAFAGKAWALKYYPAPSDRKCAVLYSTWCGSSRDAALWISEGMGGIADVFDVREAPDLKGFEHLIIGGSIRSMAVSKELQEYISGNKEWLREEVRGFFAVCGNMRKPVEAQQTTMFIDNHLAKLCAVSQVPSRVFLGRITKSLLDPETAKTMEGMEDYDNLKRSDCMTFGREIRAGITSEINRTPSTADSRR